MKKIRKRLGMTQQQLADALEVDISTVCKWETGAAAITRSRAKMIRLVLEQTA